MRTDDVVTCASRAQASDALESVIAEFHPRHNEDAGPDAGAPHPSPSHASRADRVALQWARIMDERASMASELEGVRAGAVSFKTRLAKWPRLQMRTYIADEVDHVSHAGRAAVGYLLMCACARATLPAHTMGPSARAGGASALARGGSPDRANEAHVDVPRVDGPEVRVEVATPATNPLAQARTPARTAADPVYDELGSHAPIAKTTSEKYIETLRTIDRKTDIVRRTGGWLEALRAGKFSDLVAELKSTWSNPHTYRHKISCLLGAIVHCGGAMGMSPDGYEAARAFVEQEHRDAKAAVYEKDLDNRLDKARQKRIITRAQIKSAIRKASEQLAKAQKKGDPRAMVLQQEKLWLLVLLHVPAKRSDWGRCVVLDRHPAADEDIAPTKRTKSDQGQQPQRDFNYIHVPEDPKADVVLVLRDYKTSKTYGEHKEVMPKEVAREIRASLKAYPRDFLFVDIGDEGGSQADHLKPFVKRTNYDRFARWVKKVSLKYFGIGATINDFRRRCVRDLADPSTQTRRERQETAKSMLHSLQSQELYRFVSPKKASKKPRSESESSSKRSGKKPDDRGRAVSGRKRSRGSTR